MALKAWHQEPMVWMVIAIPASAVLMGFVILTLAIGSYDGIVVDDYYEQGLRINRVLGRDQAARKAGMYATLGIDRVNSQLTLNLMSGHMKHPGTFELLMSHSTRAGNDQKIRFRQVDSITFAAPMPKLAPGRWYLVLGNAKWRLVGTLTDIKSISSLELRAASTQPVL